MKSKSSIFSVIGWVIPLAIIAGYIYYIRDDIRSISVENYDGLFFAILLTIVNVYGIGSIVDSTVRPLGVKLQFKEVLGLASITRFANHIAPGYLGAAVRAYYLKKTYGLSYSSFVACFTMANIMQILITGLFSVLLYLGLMKEGDGVGEFYYIGAIVVALILLLFIPLGFLVNILNRFSGYKIIARLSGLLRDFVTLRADRTLYVRTVCWVLFSVLSGAMVFWFIFYSLGSTENFLKLLFITCIGSWGIIFSITPGNIGVREGLMSFAAVLMGISVPVTMVVAILFRVITFLVVGGLSIYFVPLLLNTSIFSMKQRLDENKN